MSLSAKFQLWRRSAHGGVHAPHRKYTADCETVDLPVPAQVILPMVQHLGAPCVPVVKPGDVVGVGQVVGDSERPVSAPVHSSVSGTVTAITELTMPGGNRSQAVVVEADGRQEPFEGIAPPAVTTHEEFVQAVRASGLVGLGGAGFPTHIKLNPPNVEEIDTLVINAAECEPYITADYRECMENSWDILSGIRTVMEFLDVSRVIIAIENNKPAAIQELTRIAQSFSTPRRQVEVMGLPARYPQGAEKVLIAATTGRRVPPGKLPGDVGCLVMNVTSVAFLSRYLKTGMPLVERRITVDGSAVERPMNLRVPLGTPIREVLQFCGLKAPVQKLLMGGPMMGTALMDDSLPVLKQNNAILAFAAADVETAPIDPCIRCGKCVAACPMRLVPPAIAGAYALGDTEKMQALGVNTCMECGCCSYSCPAHRPIVQTMRLAKGAVRQAAAEAKKA